MTMTGLDQQHPQAAIGLVAGQEVGQGHLLEVMPVDQVRLHVDNVVLNMLVLVVSVKIILECQPVLEAVVGLRGRFGAGSQKATGRD